MIKRRYILSTVAACLMLAGCYDDQNGHDYDTVMPDVEMTIPEPAYSAGIGSVISIVPDVKTSIPDTDLQYRWEVNGAKHNEHGRETFLPLVADEKQGKELKYTCQLDTNITTLNKSYTCRLHARQLSTGRDFYSTNTFTITIAGITGLLVLHGDDASSDIGILEAEEFTPSANSLPASPTAIADMYSKSNGGRKLQGKGETIVQSIVSNLNRATDEVKKRCRIYAKTAQEVALLNKDDFSYYGDNRKVISFTTRMFSLSTAASSSGCSNPSNILSFSRPSVKTTHVRTAIALPTHPNLQRCQRAASKT